MCMEKEWEEEQTLAAALTATTIDHHTLFNKLIK